MVNTRSRPAGTEVPDVAPVTSLTARTTAKPKGRGKKAAQPPVSDRCAEDGRRAEQSGMPGEFRFQSPAREVEPPQTYEQKERVVENELAGERVAQSSNAEPCPPEDHIAMQAACPSEESIAAALACPSERIDRQATCLTERIDSHTACPTTFDTQQQRETMHLDRSEQARRAYRHAYERAEPPSFSVEHEATTIVKAGYGGGYHTPKRAARVTDTRGHAAHKGPQFFPRTFDNTSLPETVIDKLYIEEENRSDETLPAQQRISKRSREKLQRAEDLAFLQALIDDKTRHQRMRELLPEIKINDKSLLKEIQEVLESSGEEYDAFGRETDQQDEFQMPKPGPTRSKTRAQPEVAETCPTYFDKGKWQCNEDYERQIEFKRAREIAGKAEEACKNEVAKETSRKLAEGRKKPRVWIGIAIDDVRRQVEREVNGSHTALDVNTSIVALPAGGYFAEKMRARSQAPEQACADLSIQKLKKVKDSTSEGECLDSETPSDSSISSFRKSHKQRKRDSYKKKARKAEKELKRCLCRIEGKKTTMNLNSGTTRSDTRYKGQDAVRCIGALLRDKAAHWYMVYVAPDPGAYNINSLKISLYNYCFPPNHKAKLRQEFKYTHQGDKKFKDYLQELKRFQRWLPDITGRQICIKLWDLSEIGASDSNRESGSDEYDY